jgi:transposase InsO family protein
MNLRPRIRLYGHSANLPRQRGKPDALLHHSDQRGRYASEPFLKLMADNSVDCSMSRSGSVWGDATMEGFFSSLKIEATPGGARS